MLTFALFIRRNKITTCIYIYITYARMSIVGTDGRDGDRGGDGSKGRAGADGQDGRSGNDGGVGKTGGTGLLEYRTRWIM